MNRRDGVVMDHRARLSVRGPCAVLRAREVRPDHAEMERQESHERGDDAPNNHARSVGGSSENGRWSGYETARAFAIVNDDAPLAGIIPIHFIGIDC